MSDQQPSRARVRLVRRLADMVSSRQVGHPLRVAIDGPDAAGKTVLADELAEALVECGRPIIRGSIDDFHRPRVDRHRLGSDSPDGYYKDSFDYDALCRVLLLPLGPAGSREYRLRTFDHRSDTPQTAQALHTEDDAILLFDGVFLLRPDLADVWDYRIFVAATFEETVRRALIRDSPLLGSTEEVERRYRRRYIPGQKLYFAAARPEEAADAVVDNDDLANPRLRQ